MSKLVTADGVAQVLSLVGGMCPDCCVLVTMVRLCDGGRWNGDGWGCCGSEIAEKGAAKVGAIVCWLCPNCGVLIGLVWVGVFGVVGCAEAGRVANFVWLRLERCWCRPKIVRVMFRCSP